MRHMISLGLSGIFALTGCLGAQSAPPVPVASASLILPALSDTCGLSGLEPYIGRDFADLAGAGVLGDLRIVRPGQKVDGYISPSRLNVQVDAKGLVRRIFCG